jgi:putative pyruvate formate lyase activating enzyme
VVPQLLEALAVAVPRGFHLPIVYNSSGYDALPTLRLLDGVVDIYMPDFKFWSPHVAERLAKAPHYPEVARQAIREMHRQTGDLVIDKQGLARRGLLVRHLIMPNDLSGTAAFVQWLASEISPHTFVNFMDQYHPAGDVLERDSVHRFYDLARPITPAEFDAAMDAALGVGLHRFDHQRPTRRGWFH